MLNQYQISQICQGWKTDRPVEWQNVSKKQLMEWCESIKVSIDKTIREVLEKHDYVCKVDPNKIVLMDGDTFGKFAVILWDAKNEKALTDIVRSNFDALIIDKYYVCVDKLEDIPDYDKEGCRGYYSSIQGLSYKEYQIINKMSADGGLGLHLLCHEIFHTLASPACVKKLRNGNNMGDEATNEFIARLVSKDNQLGGTTTDEMLKNSNNDSVHNKYGCYGKLLEQEGFFKKTPDETKRIIEDYLAI